MLLAAVHGLLGRAAPARAWDGHDRITRAAIASVGWLDDYSHLIVTPFADRIEGIQPAYRFEFRGEHAGDTMPAREILVRYAAEPDWGFDQDLHASWQQAFMGGYTGLSSQAYFHMYYPAFTVHMPVPGIAMGAAPRRLALFQEAARAAFERNDPYWGFRYLACALHYIQDVGQPYHSTQTSVHFLDLNHPIDGTTKITSNYHLVYEGWVDHHMRLELRAAAQTGREGGFGFLAALRGSDAHTYPELHDYVEQVAHRSHRNASRLLRACVDFFDRRFKQPVDVAATDQDLAQIEPEEPRRRIVEATLPALRLTGQSIRGFLEHSRRRLVARAQHEPAPAGGRQREAVRAARFEALHEARGR
jgi:hypothetical protein